MSHLVSSSPPIASAHTVKRYAGFGILGADIPTGGTSGGSPVNNDSPLPGSEYYWRLETAPASGNVTIYPDLTFVHTGAADGTWTWQYRLFEDRVDQGLATVTDVFSSAVSLIIASATHGHLADSLTLGATGSTSLSVQDSAHAHAADSLALSTSAYLAIADALHAHGADSIGLTTATNLLIAEAVHAHFADSIDLSTDSSASLAIDDALHGHLADGVALSQSNWLVIADSQHGHLADTLLLDPGQRALVIASARHPHFADQLLLSLPGGLLTSDSDFIISLAKRLLSITADTRNPDRSADNMTLTKDPAEIITVTFDFSALAAAVSNPVVACTVIGIVPDADAAAMVFGAPQIDGARVLQRIAGGVPRAIYKLRCQIDDADGERWAVAAKLKVVTA